jgi:hypothetical protein
MHICMHMIIQFNTIQYNQRKASAALHTFTTLIIMVVFCAMNQPTTVRLNDVIHYYALFLQELQIFTLRHRTVGCFDEFAQPVLIYGSQYFFAYDMLIYCIEACIEIVLFSELLCFKTFFMF